MTREEFNGAIDYLAEGIGKPMGMGQKMVFWDLLQDLPAPALMVAVQRALLEARENFIPTVGTLRDLAIEALCGASGVPTVGEALEQIRKVYTHFDAIPTMLRGKLVDRRADALAQLHPCVRRAVEQIGTSSICLTGPAAATWRAQFRDIYKVVSEKVERLVRLPPPVYKVLADVAEAWKLDENAPARLTFRGLEQGQ